MVYTHVECMILVLYVWYIRGMYNTSMWFFFFWVFSENPAAKKDEERPRGKNVPVPSRFRIKKASTFQGTPLFGSWYDVSICRALWRKTESRTPYLPAATYVLLLLLLLPRIICTSSTQGNFRIQNSTAAIRVLSVKKAGNEMLHRSLRTYVWYSTAVSYQQLHTYRYAPRLLYHSIQYVRCFYTTNHNHG